MKLSYENSLFQLIFHDFHLFLKMIPVPNKSSLFNKIPTLLVENKNFSQNLVFAFAKYVFCCLDLESGLEEKIQDPDP